MTGGRSHREATVEIKNVQDEYNGEYSCVAVSSLAGQELDRKESKAMLKVLDVPKPPTAPMIITVS